MTDAERHGPPSENLRKLLIGLLLAAAYVVTGKLALLLALPPGYASPIFPPAGIAVAAAFIGGMNTLPWVLLGSALLNLWVGYSPAQSLTAIGVASAIIIAFASTLQAAIGGWSLRKLIGYPSSLDNVRDVVLVLLLSPVICLVSSSLSVSGLTALETIEAVTFATNWFTWWIGDTLGLIVLLPIVMALAAEPRPLWRRRIKTIVIPMLLAFSFVVVVFVQASRWEHEESMVEFHIRSQQMADNVQASFEEQEALLEGVVAFLSHDLTKPVTREEFQRVLQKLLTRYPMVQAVEWAPRIEHAQRASFEASLQSELPEFKIVEQSASWRLRPAQDRAYYYPVTYIEPVSSNRAAIGLDIASSPERREAISATLALGLPVATAPLRLVQEKGHQAGVLLLLEVGEGGNAPGLALTVLRVGDFIDSALPHDRSSFLIQLKDEAAQQSIYGMLDESKPRTLTARSLNFGTRHYLLQIQPSDRYLEQHRGWQSWTVLVVELLGTGLLGAFLLLGTGYTARVEAQVVERTEALCASEERWKFALEGAGDGVWDWNLQTGELFLSKQEMTVLGYDGEPATYSHIDEWVERKHPDDREPLSSAIDRYLSGESPLYVCEFRTRARDGAWKWILERGMLVSRTADGKPLRMIGTHSDITARKEMEAELRRLATTDPLTGVANRRCFLEQLDKELARIKRFGMPASLLMVDIDHFKRINDSCGHAAGDAVLKHFAASVYHHLRSIDLFGRIGGEEFAILLPGTDREGARKFAEQLRRYVAETPAHPAESEIHITVSIGVTEFDPDDLVPDTIFARADEALYRAKQGGRDRIELS